MGCPKLTYRTEFLSVWRRDAYEKSDHGNFLPLGEKNDGKETRDNYYPFGAVAQSYQRENSLDNKFLYQGKERITDLGMDEYDFGPRRYDGWRGQTTTQDPHAEKFYSMSPYSWCANNPVRYVDPTGMEVEDPDKIYAKQKKQVTDNLAALKGYLKQDGLSEGLTKAINGLIGIHETALNEMSALEKSDQVYTVFSAGGKEGGVSYDMQSQKVKIGIGKEDGGSVELVGHELKHAYQFETGQVSLRADNSGYGSLYDLGDETAAYNRGRALAGGALAFSNPNFIWNNNDTKEFGKKMNPPAYQALPPGPIDINSPQGIRMQLKSTWDGMNGRSPQEVYKGWKQAYNQEATNKIP